MKPILFDANDFEYEDNGLGILVDVGYCTVTEERNGKFELELQYPVNGSHYSDLAVDRQIFAKPSKSSRPQPFRIYRITKPMNGVVIVSAEHISYQLSNVLVSPFSASSITDAFTKIESHSIGENPFEFWTDKSTVANMKVDAPASVRYILGGSVGSILDVYGGEFEFDRHIVKLHQNRGSDNGFTIAYAKNLTGVNCEERIDGIVTGAIAYWSSDVDGTQKTVYSDLQTIETNLSYSRNISVDCSADFENEPTKEQLNAKALNFISSAKNVPYFSVSVEFVNLGDTEEYKQYKGLYNVELCDTVTVKHPLYGINVNAKVVKTVFDSVNEKYEKIEVGEASSTISDTIAVQSKEVAQKVAFSDLDKAIINATNAITGNKGGHVVLYPPNQPQELLILDEPKLEDAVNVWRWNLNGLGHSSTGYDGNYTTAITADGQIVADFITTGTMSANRVRAGLLSSENGQSWLNLNDGSFNFKNVLKLSNGDLVMLGKIISANNPNCYAKIGQSDDGEFANSFTVSADEGQTFSVYPVSGSAGNSVVWTPPFLTNSAGTNRKGINIGPDYISFFSDSNGLPLILGLYKDNIEVAMRSGATRKDLWINYFPPIGGYAPDIFILGNGDNGSSGVNYGRASLDLFSLYLQGSIYANNRIAFRWNKTTSPNELSIGIDTAPMGIYGTYVDVHATKFRVNGVEVVSDRDKKSDIQTYKKNALSKVNEMSFYSYELNCCSNEEKEENETGKKSKKKSSDKIKKHVDIGLMADEAPEEILGDDKKSIDLYKYISFLAKAVQELSQKVDDLEGKIS